MRRERRVLAGFLGLVMGVGCAGWFGDGRWIRVERELGRADADDAVAEVVLEDHAGQPVTRLTVRRASDGSALSVEIPGPPAGPVAPEWTSPQRVELVLDQVIIVVRTRP